MLKLRFCKIGEGRQILSASDVRKYKKYDIEILCISKSVQKIAFGAFHGCVGVKSIIFEAGSECEEIEEHAFSGCVYLTRITMPLSLKIIGRRAFAYCPFIETLLIPWSVTEIGEEAFWYCVNLKSVNILNPSINTCKHIFTGCYILENVQIGAVKYLTQMLHDRIALYKTTRKFQDKLTCRAKECTVISQGQVQGPVVYFIWGDDDRFHGYGKNLHEALEEYEFEVGADDLRKEMGVLTADTEISMSQYRLLTKDCKEGVEEFLLANNINFDDKMKIRDIYEKAGGQGRSRLLQKIIFQETT